MSSFLSDPLDPDLLDRYLSGELSEEQQRVVALWLASHPEWEAVAARLSQLELDSALPPLHSDIESDWTRVQMRSRYGSGHSSALSGATSVLAKPRETSQPRFRVRQAIAALSVGVILLAAGWWTGVSRSMPAETSQMSIYTTKKGERATVTLPDGSTVVLNVASRLEVPTDYLQSNRSVRLAGEAFFTVIPNAAKAFTVTTGSSTTRVLGTTFIVRQYSADTIATIAVRDGKIAVGPVVLTANQTVAVGTTGTPQVKTASEKQFGFVNGVLAIEDLTLLAAIPELNRWYDADIRLGDPSLARRRIVGAYEAGSLTDLMSIMELTFDVRVVRDGRVLTLYPRG